MGKTFTLADVAVFPYIAFLVFHGYDKHLIAELMIVCTIKKAVTFSPYLFRLSEDRYPQLAACYKCLKERPSIKASWPPSWVENPEGYAPIKDIVKKI